jgi:hypothetical protein
MPWRRAFSLELFGGNYEPSALSFGVFALPSLPWQTAHLEEKALRGLEICGVG